MIDDRHVHAVEPARDRLADAAHPDQAHGAVAQRRLAERIAALAPLAGAQETLGLGELARRAQEEADRRIGDLLGEHVGRIGDHDAMLAGPGRIDMVVADPES